MQAAANCAPDGQNCIPARQYFSDCYIAGNVDFIFGDGKAVFDHCEIHSTAHDADSLPRRQNIIRRKTLDSCSTMQAHCRFRRNQACLSGPAWRPYSTVVFLDTRWEVTSILQAGASGIRERHIRSKPCSNAEYNSLARARPDQRDPHTHFLTQEQARQFAPSVFLRGADNWDPLQLIKQ